MPRLRRAWWIAKAVDKQFAFPILGKGDRESGGWGESTLLCLPRLGKVSAKPTDGERTVSGTVFALTASPAFPGWGRWRPNGRRMGRRVPATIHASVGEADGWGAANGNIYYVLQLCPSARPSFPLGARKPGRRSFLLASGTFSPQSGAKV